MQDKDLVNDILEGVKSSLADYARAIAESGNPQLRQVLTQSRNECEMFQYQLSQVAMKKGWYTPAQQASPQEIAQVRQAFMS